MSALENETEDFLLEATELLLLLEMEEIFVKLDREEDKLFKLGSLAS
jgi:hypothetical protein